MKNIILFALFAVAVTETIDYYETDNDHLDMDALLDDHNELKAHLDCYLDKRPCSDLTTSYKKVIQGSIKDACRRCNDNQKYMYRRFLEGVKDVFPEQYVEFKRHYDPENKHFDALENELSKYLSPLP